ncbi:MAG: type I-MYXAN CRISPR-associated protein Cas6/Cmx6 [Nitrosomonadales bacterium]|nr:type I-MYXAN CRISPR-associated protein Cas6/Cmx6 [Nitrosomonadales bacterium]
MTRPDCKRIDWVFDLAGGSLPASYPFALWDELVRLAPELADDERVGVLPLRTAESDGICLLPKRAKLVLRLPLELNDAATRLSGARFEIADATLALGQGRMRPIQPYPTVHAQLVADERDELTFMAEVNARLAELDIQAQIICGRRGALNGDEVSIAGYSLVLHDLKPYASVHLQCVGMGRERRYGCGVFVPYKAISSLE